mmetsp:Transcript_3651/g.14367  ORF Transcript_3651/g.14367 Transcript_3651/m.14367 type:complete len:944 (+) Transcript_3651:4560-7391(+)
MGTQAAPIKLNVDMRNVQRQYRPERTTCLHPGLHQGTARKRSSGGTTTRAYRDHLGKGQSVPGEARQFGEGQSAPTLQQRVEQRKLAMGPTLQPRQGRSGLEQIQQTEGGQPTSRRREPHGSGTPETAQLQRLQEGKSASDDPQLHTSRDAPEDGAVQHQSSPLRPHRVQGTMTQAAAPSMSMTSSPERAVLPHVNPSSTAMPRIQPSDATAPPERRPQARATSASMTQIFRPPVAGNQSEEVAIQGPNAERVLSPLSANQGVTPEPEETIPEARREASPRRQLALGESTTQGDSEHAPNNALEGELPHDKASNVTDAEKTCASLPGQASATSINKDERRRSAGPTEQGWSSDAPNHRTPFQADVAVTMDDIRDSQATYLGHMLARLRQGGTVTSSRYDLRDGIIFVRTGQTYQSGMHKVVATASVPLVPYEDQNLREHIVRLYHEASPFLGAHPGEATTTMRIRERFFWARIELDVKKCIKACVPCKMAKAFARRNMGLYRLRSYDKEVTADGDAVAYDHIITQGRETRGIATVTDISSGYVVVYAIERQDHDYLLERFEVNYICTYGVPRLMVADSEIDSTIWRDFSRAVRMRLSITTPHHAESNGVAERTNRSVQEILRAFLSEDGGIITADGDWRRYLPYVQSALNSRNISGTSFSPYQAKFGRVYRSPLDMLLIPEYKEGRITNAPIKAQIQQRIAVVRKIRGLVNQSRVERRAAVILKLNKHQKNAPLAPGDTVMRHVKARPLKLASRTVGPYEIIRQLRPEVYQLRHLQSLAIVTAHRRELILLDGFREQARYRDLAKPHLVQEVDGASLRKHDLLVWRYRATNAVRQRMIARPVFVSEIAQMQPGRLLLHTYLDTRPSRAMDTLCPVVQRRLAPGYARMVSGQKFLLGSWTPRPSDAPLYEFLLVSHIEIVIRIDPLGLSPEGWTEQAARELRAY